MKPASATYRRRCCSSAAESFGRTAPCRRPCCRAPRSGGPVRAPIPAGARACSRRPARRHNSAPARRARACCCRAPRSGWQRASGHALWVADQSSGEFQVPACPRTVQPRWPASMRPISNAVRRRLRARHDLGRESGATITAMPTPQLNVRAISSRAISPPCLQERRSAAIASARHLRSRGNRPAEPVEYSREVRRR